MAKTLNEMTGSELREKLIQIRDKLKTTVKECLNLSDHEAEKFANEALLLICDSKSQSIHL
jgi:hypothetical protein